MPWKRRHHLFRLRFQYLKDKSLEELYSSVVIPVRNELDEETETYIYKTARETIVELSDHSPEQVREGTTENSIEVISNELESTGALDVLCIPARDEADDVVGMLLARLLIRRGHRSQSVSIATTADVFQPFHLSR
jgi:hypothetical protein